MIARGSRYATSVIQEEAHPQGWVEARCSGETVQFLGAR